MRVAETIVGGLCTSLLSLGLYAQAGGYIPFLLGLSSLRMVDAPDAGLDLRAVDAETMCRTGWLLWALPGLAAPLGWAALLVWSVALAVLWGSFRLRLRAVATETTLRRYLLWIVPWRTRRAPGTPSFYVDGWGDFADPEALHVALPGGLGNVEPAWSSAQSGRLAEQLVAEAGKRLASPGPTGPSGASGRLRARSSAMAHPQEKWARNIVVERA